MNDWVLPVRRGIPGSAGGPGSPVASPSAVIGAVIGGRAAHAPEIDGVFWRAGEPWQLVVEQPYVAPSQAPPLPRKHRR